MAELRAALAALGYRAEMPAAWTTRAGDDEDARVPVSLALAWFSDAEHALGDPLLGLHAAREVRPRGALVHLIMSAARLGDAFDHVCRFSRLLIDALDISLELGRHACALRFAFDRPALAQDRHLLDYSLLATSRVLYGAAGDTLPLTEVHFRHAEPAHSDDYIEAFRCAVYFDQAEDRLLFHRDALDMVPRVANPLVARQMEKLAEALVARTAVPSSCATRVSALLRAALTAGRLGDRAAAARELAMSEATLNRRLAREGTNFRALRDAIVWEVTDALLANPTLKLEVIARSVGFNDAAAFTRAFTRRAGCSPSAYRRRLLGVGAD